MTKQLTEDKTMRNMTTQAAMEYVETLHQRSNDARYMSICEKVNEAKHALIRERDELESKCNAYDTYVSLCCERGGSYDAFYSFSDSLYDSMRDEMLKHVDDDEEYEAVYDSVRELSDCDVVAMYIELFGVDEAEVFKKLDSASDELRDAVVNEVEYMTDYDENETLHELRNALAEDEQESNQRITHNGGKNMKYYNIDENIACTAHSMVHMSDYVLNSATNSYRAAVDKAATLVEERKAKVSNYYHEKLDSILDCYSRRLAEWTNAYNRNQASYPSQFVAGASGYNMKKHNKQMSREDTLWKEYSEIQDLLNKIKTVGTGAVDLADPNAREILTEQLQQLRCKLEQCKALNAYYRKHQSFVDFPNMSADAAEKLTAEFNETRLKCPWIDKPCPDYELTSLRGKIKRVQARLDELDKLDAARVTQTDAIVFAGGEIVKNAELNRLQIIFHEIPDADTRATLKNNGFRWSPRYGAWQRQLTQSAENAARRILGCEGKGGCND